MTSVIIADLVAAAVWLILVLFHLHMRRKDRKFAAEWEKDAAAIDKMESILGIPEELRFKNRHPPPRIYDGIPGAVNFALGVSAPIMIAACLYEALVYLTA